MARPHSSSAPFVQTDQRAERQFAVFQTELGWMGLCGWADVVCRLWVGYGSRQALVRTIMGSCGDFGTVEPSRFGAPLLRRLQRYAVGHYEDFSDVKLDPGPISPFQRRVLQACRRVAWGQTVTYAELASLAGFPGAARAVGNCMAKNPLPILIPCHRVIRSDGHLGGYSAPHGMALKQRLLELERGWKPGPSPPSAAP